MVTPTPGISPYSTANIANAKPFGPAVNNAQNPSPFDNSGPGQGMDAFSAAPKIPTGVRIGLGAGGLTFLGLGSWWQWKLLTGKHKIANQLFSHHPNGIFKGVGQVVKDNWQGIIKNVASHTGSSTSILLGLGLGATSVANLRNRQPALPPAAPAASPGAPFTLS
jgi:hypothetical protein